MKLNGRISLALLAALWLITIALVAQAQANITKESFGKTEAGENVDLYTLRNSHGVEAKITNFGGRDSRSQ